MTEKKLLVQIMREQLTQAEISLFLMGDPASINYNSSTFQDQVFIISVYFQFVLILEILTILSFLNVIFSQYDQYIKVSLLPYDPGLEFPKERLKLGKQIGSGAFGRVLRAEALGKTLIKN